MLIAILTLDRHKNMVELNRVNAEPAKLEIFLQVRRSSNK